MKAARRVATCRRAGDAVHGEGAGGKEVYLFEDEGRWFVEE